MRSSAETLERWNRRLHYFTGLYFLSFLWLFSLTGLMLNHQQWFRNLYERGQYSYEMPIETPAGGTRAEHTRDLMRQLQLRGEVDWPASQPVGHIDFNVSRPRLSVRVRADLNAKRAYITEFDNGLLHTVQIFHTFSGSRYTQPDSERDWIVTSAWVWAMDALAAGLVVMVFGSYYMWWRVKKRHALGLAVLAAGFLACAALVTSLFGAL